MATHRDFSRRMLKWAEDVFAPKKLIWSSNGWNVKKKKKKSVLIKF